jgi:hypothetical protein
MRVLPTRSVYVRNDKGASALEFALVVPLLLVLVFGMIEFGFVFQAQLALTHAAREGARLASVNKYSAATVANRAYPLTSAGGLVISGPADLGDAVKVTASFPYHAQVLVGLPVMNLRSDATMRKEY